jgi:predicted permease
MIAVINDIKYAFRQLIRSPCFTLVAGLTLAVGIGTNTAIFSTIDALLLQRLPYDESEQLVAMDETFPDGQPNLLTSGGAFLDWKQNTQSYEYVAMSGMIGFNLTDTGQPERVMGLEVTADYLKVLRIDPILGRGFSPDADQIGGDNRVVVLNHAYWKTHFGSDMDVMGRMIMLDREPYTIIGVLGPNRIIYHHWEKEFDVEVSLLVPVVIDSSTEKWKRMDNWGQVIGRLKPGMSVAEANAEAYAIRKQLESAYRPNFKENWSLAITPLQDKWFPKKARPILITLCGTTAMVLLIVCANVGNLLLARGNARQKEMAVRAALGAGSWRIIRQVLIESLVLALIGGVLGVIVAYIGVDLPARAVTGLFPEIRHPELNIRVLLFSVGLACGCGLLFGTLPALKACKIDCQRALEEGSRSGISRTRVRSQSLLVISEVTLTVLLLIGAGLFLRSFLHILHVDPGFNPEKTLAFDLRFTDDKYPQRMDRHRFIKNLRTRLSEIPGVESAAAAFELPLSGEGNSGIIERNDRPDSNQDITDSSSVYRAGRARITSDYFAAAGIRLLRGRTITEADNREKASRVIVINNRVARDLYPNEDPIGKYINLHGRKWEIVGIVESVRYSQLDSNPQPRVYIAHVNFPDRTSMIVRSAVPPMNLIPAIRQTVSSADPDLPMFNIRTLGQAIQGSVAKKQTLLILIGCFAAVAVGLACMGLYGFMSCFVGQRTRELSIRAALGAQPYDIIKRVVGVGMKLSIIGIAVGLFAALALTRLVKSQLFEVKIHDPLVYIVSICLVGFVAFLSVYLPARRAAKIDPMEALRYE